jgi:hypothetical protein
LPAIAWSPFTLTAEMEDDHRVFSRRPPRRKQQ